MSKRVLSDNDIATLESKQKRVISDDDMSKLESLPAEDQSSWLDSLSTGLQKIGESASLGLTKPINAVLDSFVWNPEKSYDKAMEDETNRIKAMEEKNPVASGIGTLIGSVATPMPIKGAGYLKNAGIGGAVGAISSGISNNSLEGGLAGGALGAGLGAGTHGLAQLLGKAGDIGMQAAIGKNKYTPGLGKQLASEGLIGTRGQMTSQVEKGLQTRGQEIGRLASEIPEIQGAPVRQAIQDAAGNIRLSDNSVRLNDIGEADLANRLAADIPESMSGAYAASRRRAAGASGFNKSGTPRSSFESNLDRAEQGALSRSLKEGYAAINPENANAMREADAAYSALIKAKKPLTQELTVPRSLFGIASTPFNLVGGALPTSAASRAAISTEKALDQFNPELMRLLFNSNRE